MLILARHFKIENSCQCLPPSPLRQLLSAFAEPPPLPADVICEQPLSPHEAAYEIVAWGRHNQGLSPEGMKPEVQET